MLVQLQWNILLVTMKFNEVFFKITITYVLQVSSCNNCLRYEKNENTGTHLKMIKGKEPLELVGMDLIVNINLDITHFFYIKMCAIKFSYLLSFRSIAYHCNSP